LVGWTELVEEKTTFFCKYPTTTTVSEMTKADLACLGVWKDTTLMPRRWDLSSEMRIDKEE
jgi:hypothetical protein